MTDHENGLGDQQDEGFTLVELLMVILLLGIVGSITAAGIATALKTTRQDSTRSTSTSLLDTQLQRFTRDVRVADPARLVGGNDLVLDVYRSGGCSRVEWRVSGTTLQQRTLIYSTASACNAYPANSAASSDSGYLTRISNVTSATPFSYLDAAGVALTTPTTTTVKQVVITITQSQPENRAAITMSAAALLRNAT